MAVADGGRQLHNLGTYPVKSSMQEPSTRKQLGLFVQSIAWHLGNRSDSQYSVLCWGAVQSGNQVPILYRETRRPHSCCAKERTWILLGTWESNEETWVVPQELPRASNIPRTHESQKQASARGCPNAAATNWLLQKLAPTLAVVFCKVLNPWHQLLKASV